MKEAKCPLCGEKIRVGIRPWRGQQIECSACDAVLEVVGLSPVSLDWPYDDEGYISFNYDQEKGELDRFNS
jgi:lysine biosynthesis protein LysW